MATCSFHPLHWLPVHSTRDTGCLFIPPPTLAANSFHPWHWLQVHSSHYTGCQFIPPGTLAACSFLPLHWLPIHSTRDTGCMFIPLPTLADCSLYPFSVLFITKSITRPCHYVSLTNCSPKYLLTSPMYTLRFDVCTHPPTFLSFVYTYENQNVWSTFVFNLRPCRLNQTAFRTRKSF